MLAEASPRAAVVRSEWVKLRTLRPVMLALSLALVTAPAIGLLAGFSLRSATDRGSAVTRDGLDPVSTGFLGTQTALVPLLVFGVLTIGGEYRSGMIHTSLTAVPDRTWFFVGKAAATTGVAFPVAVVASALSFPLTQWALGPYGLDEVDSGLVIRVLLGAPLYLTLTCLLAFGVAAVLRSPAPAVGGVLALLFVVPPLMDTLPGLRDVTRFLPDHAGNQLMLTETSAGSPSDAVTAVLVLLVWVTTVLAAGLLALHRRDPRGGSGD